MHRNKKSGFTLAEMLITLVIIGSITALTIPSLITYIQEEQYKTAWKKEYSDMQQVINKMLIDNGGSLKGLYTDRNSVKNAILPYISYIKQCDQTNSGCFHSASNWYQPDGTSFTWGYQEVPAVILNNGMLLAIDSDSPGTINGCSQNTNVCFGLIIDVNGFKGPNMTGKDIFYIEAFENHIKPAGYQGDVFTSYTATCSNTNGLGCSSEFLKQ